MSLPMSLFDYVSKEVMEKLIKGYAEATGVAARLADPDGKTLLGPENSTRLCQEFNYQLAPSLCHQCAKKHSAMASDAGGYDIYQCDGGGAIAGDDGAGLWDAVAHIRVGGQHLADLLCGQVLLKAPDRKRIEQFRRFAENKLGLQGESIEEYMRALQEVPCMSAERFQGIVQMLHWLANIISDYAHHRNQLNHMLPLWQVGLTDPMEVYGQLLTRVSNIVGGVVGINLWYADGRGQLLLRATLNFDLEHIGRRVMDLDKCVCGRAFLAHRIIVTDPINDPDFLDERLLFNNTNIAKLMVVPFYDIGRDTTPLAALEIFLRSGYELPEEGVQLIILHAGAHIQAVVHTQRERLLAAILQTSSDILDEPSSDFWQAIDRNMAVTLESVTSYAIHRLDKRTRKFQLMTSKVGRADQKYFTSDKLHTFAASMHVDKMKLNGDVCEHEIAKVREKWPAISQLLTDGVINRAIESPRAMSWGVVRVPVLGQGGELIGTVVCLTNAAPTRHPTSPEIAFLGTFGQGDLVALKGIAATLSIRFTQEYLEDQRELEYALKSHDLIAPIHAIQGYSENLEILFRRVRPQLTANDSIGEMFDTQLARLKVSCDMLELISRSRALKGPFIFSETNLLEEIVSSIITPLRAYAREEKRSSIEYTENFKAVPSLFLVRDDMKRAFFNIVYNAVKYSNGDSHIWVQFEEAQDCFKIHIINQGIGVPLGEEEAIFGLFKKGSNADLRHEGGSGMGLHIAREVLRRHAGNIVLSDRRPQNTQFTMILPVWLKDRPPIRDGSTVLEVQDNEKESPCGGQ